MLRQTIQVLPDAPPVEAMLRVDHDSVVFVEPMNHSQNAFPAQFVLACSDVTRLHQEITALFLAAAHLTNGLGPLVLRCKLDLSPLVRASPGLLVCVVLPKPPMLFELRVPLAVDIVQAQTTCRSDPPLTQQWLLRVLATNFMSTDTIMCKGAVGRSTCRMAVGPRVKIVGSHGQLRGCGRRATRAHFELLRPHLIAITDALLECGLPGPIVEQILHYWIADCAASTPIPKSKKIYLLVSHSVNKVLGALAFACRG